MMHYTITTMVLLLIIFGSMRLFDFLADQNKATLGWVMFGLVYAMFSPVILVFVSWYFLIGYEPDNSVFGTIIVVAEVGGVGLAIWFFSLLGLIVFWRDRSLGFTVFFAAICAILAYGAKSGEANVLPIPAMHEVTVFGLIGSGFFLFYLYFREPRNASSAYVTKDIGYSYDIRNRPRAEMAILHRPEVSNVWENVQNLGGEWPRRFLDKMERDPRSDPISVVKQVGDDLGEAYPFIPGDMLAAYSSLSDLSKHDQREFRTTIYTLADDVTPASVASSIITRRGAIQEHR